MKNILKTNLRYLWRNRLFTLLNIVGLSIGISACWIVFSILHYEFSFEKGIPENQNIHQIYSGENNPDYVFMGIPRGMTSLLHETSLDDTYIVPIYNKFFEQLHAPSSSNTVNELVFDVEEVTLQATHENYFKMLPYNWILGNSDNPFDDPFSLVLTEKKAKEFFPGEELSSLAGKSIKIDSILYSINGIIQDLDFPSSFHGEVFIPISESDWNSHNWHRMNSNDRIFVKTNDINSLQHLLKVAQDEYDKVAKDHHAKFGEPVVFKSFPLNEIHFTPAMDATGKSTEKNVLYGILLIGAFLLLLACINYINLSTSQIPQRAKEIGIRKTLGIRSSLLTFNFILETAMIVAFSLLLSIPLVSLFYQFFPEFVPADLNYFQNNLLLSGFLFLLFLVITLFSSLYPAYLINKVNVMETLKGQKEKKISGTQLTLRKMLVIFQFVIAQVFIISAIIIGHQLNYTLNKDLGYEYDAIVTQNMPYKNYQGGTIDPQIYKNALEKYPEFESITRGHSPQSNNHWITVFYLNTDTGKMQLTTGQKMMDPNFLDFYNIKLVAGENLKESGAMNEIIINETAAQMLGFRNAQDAIGKTMTSINDPNLELPIVGVVKNFHQKSFHTDIEPLVMGTSKNRSDLQTFHIKLSANKKEWANAFTIMEKEWKNVYPNAPFKYEFVDEKIKNLYISEIKMAKLINLATGITIFISCLGLFGLATLTAYQKIKEIGIRKVLGASVGSIVLMLSNDFIKLIIIAILIATPLTWWAMNLWLNNFAYRVEIQIWMFLLAGFLAVIIALGTLSWQAIRAAIANPVDSLKDE